MKTTHNILSLEGNQKDQKKLEKSITSEKLPYDLTAVSSVSDAREVLDLEEFDLVLIAHDFNDSTTFDLVDVLYDIPYIFLARNGTETTAVQSLKSGASDYLIKDTEDEYLTGLSTAIEQAIQEKDQERESHKYNNKLEEIVAERAHGLMESNQLLTYETLQRSQALAKLRESKEIYRRFFQTSHDAVFITSEDGRWIDMNMSAIELFGYQQTDEIWNDSILDFYQAPKERDEFTRALKEQGFLKNYPLKLLKKDGSKFDALVSATPHEVGGIVIGHQGIIRDITKELREEKERQQILMQQTVIDNLSIEMGTILTLNEIYERIISGVQELIEVDIFILSRYTPERKINKMEFVWGKEHSKVPDIILPATVEIISKSSQSQVFQSGKPFYIPDFWKYIQDNDLMDGVDLERGENSELELVKENVAGSMLLAPLIIDNQVTGLLQILSDQSNAYSQEILAVFARIANVVAIGLQKAHFLEESEKHLEQLKTLHRIEQVFLENLSLSTTLDLMVDQLVKELEIDAADILYFHPVLKTLKFITQTGFRKNTFHYKDLDAGEGVAGEAAQSGSTIYIPDLTQEDSKFSQSSEFTAEEFISYIGVPLLVKGKLVGVLEVFHRSPLDPPSEWLELLEMMAGLLAIAIDHQNLQKDLEHSRTEIIKGFDLIIEGWVNSLEMRGIESQGHSSRVVDLTLRLAQELGLTGDTLLDIRRGSLLHDIGKMCIPDQILNKGGKLTGEERKIIGRHPIEANNLLESIDALNPALDIPLYHHERWDGEGYPYGLKEEEIPFHARIFALADVWDATRTDRPYRKAWSEDKAMAHIKEQSGKHFDPQVVNAFMEIIAADKKLEQEQKLSKEKENKQGNIE